MKKRQIIIVLIALGILVLGYLGKSLLGEPAERQPKASRERVTTVFVDTVKLRSIPITVKSTGSIEAKDRMELYSEVQGMMLPDQGKFKAGTTFNQGEALMRLRNDNVQAGIVAQRSAFARSLSATMADMRLDFKEFYSDWVTYLNAIDPEKSLAPLPVVTDAKLKSYLNGKNIYTDYYNVRNSEILLSRYQINAPFKGILVQANANPGTIIRPGQLLGVFVKPGVYELKASTDARTLKSLEKGQAVTVSNSSGQKFEGKITRINASLDPQTQMSEFFVELKSDELKEGQFMSLEVEAKTIENAFELNRSALRDSQYAYVVEDSKLKKVQLDVLHKTENTVVVKGLELGQIVLNKLPPSAFEGMSVKIYGETASE